MMSHIRNAYNAKTALLLFVSHGFFLPESCLHCITLYIRHLPALCMCARTAIWLTEHFQCHPPRLPPLSGGFSLSFLRNFRSQQLVHRALKCSHQCRQHLDAGISRTALPCPAYAGLVCKLLLGHAQRLAAAHQITG